MYSSIYYNILSSTLTPRYAILLCLRHVYDLFLYRLERKKTYKNKKKRVAKWICFANALFKVELVTGIEPATC